MTPLRLLSYNIRAGLGMDKVRDLNRIARVIQSFSPDLLVVQEIDRCVARSGCVDQFQMLVEKLGFHGHFAKTIDLEGGEYGIALFSQWPVLQHFTVPLPTQEGHENRVLAGIKVHPPELATPLWWLGTHLACYSAPLRLAQAEAIEAFVSTHLREELPIVLAGDFNASRRSPSLQLLCQQWEIVSCEAPTYPANAPEADIDHILLRKKCILRCHSADLLPEAMASDHLPTSVILNVKPQASDLRGLEETRSCRL